MFRFGDSEAFYTYLSVVPFVIFIGWVLARRAGKKISKQLGHRLAPFLASSISMTKRRVKFVLEILTIILFVIAMARPQLGSSLQEVKSEGLEMMFLIDVSQSMMAEDNKPNRLEMMKIELKRLLDRLTGDKVGLVVFAGNAFLISPLTNDYSAVKLFIDTLSTDSVSTQGTEIRSAIDTAVEAFKRGGVDQDEGVVVTRVILIASDGEDHDQGTIDTAKKYHSQGYRFFALGAGTEQGAPIPQRDHLGYLKGHLKDQSGKIVNSQHRGDFLTSVAVAGGGGYYHISNPSSVDEIKKQLDQLQRAQLDSQFAMEYDERFQIFLLLGILLALLELFLGDRKTVNHRWRGQLGAPTVALIILFSSSANAVVTPNTIKKNNEAAKWLEEKQSYQAYRQLAELLSEAPFQPEVRLNIAYSLELNDEIDKALQEYLLVAKSDAEPKLRFEAHFNAARLLASKKKIKEALENYQMALNIEPNSIETKTNIELLFQQQKGGGEQSKNEKENQNKDQQDKKDSQQNQEKEEQNKSEENKQGKRENPKRAPQPYKSEELSERDMKNIMEELRRQEEKNRAKVMEKPTKERSDGPNW